MFNLFQSLLPPATISDDDEFYAECGAESINLVDRVNGKPVAVYHYSIDRPNANWHSSPKTDESDCLDDDFGNSDEPEEEVSKKWWQL